MDVEGEGGEVKEICEWLDCFLEEGDAWNGEGVPHYGAS